MTKDEEGRGPCCDVAGTLSDIEENVDFPPPGTYRGRLLGNHAYHLNCRSSLCLLPKPTPAILLHPNLHSYGGPSGFVLAALNLSSLIAISILYTLARITFGGISRGAS